MPDQDGRLAKFESRQQHNINIDGLVVEEQVKLPGHSWNISCLQFSQNGLYLASGSWDKTVCIWDLHTLDEPKLLDGEGKGHTEAVTCLEWLPQIEFLLASGSADCSLLIWNSDTGDIMARLNEHKSWVLGSSFTEDGKMLASASWDSSVVLWDMNMLKPINQLQGHSAGVWACSFNRNSSSPILCSASEDMSLRLWDMRTDNKWHSDAMLSGVHNDAIKCCCWSPGGNYIAAGSSDSKISVWDVRENKMVNCLLGHAGPVADLSFVPSMENLLFSVGDTHCRVWNILDPQGAALSALEQHSWSYEIESMAVSPDSTLLATGGVDKNIVLSTLDLSESLPDHWNSDVDTLPYAQMPVKTQSSSSLPLGISSANVVDKAKTVNLNKERALNQAIAKQTIRIKAPVTSEYLQDKLLKLKTISNEKVNVIGFWEGLKVPETVDDGSIRYKSKELLAERQKLRSTSFAGAGTQSMEGLDNTYNSIPDEPRNIMISELQDRLSTGRSSASSEYDIDIVAAEMIKLSEEQGSTYF